MEEKEEVLKKEVIKVEDVTIFSNYKISEDGKKIFSAED